jgi:hypothetical protein
VLLNAKTPDAVFYNYVTKSGTGSNSNSGGANAGGGTSDPGSGTV